jgi:hypothetical protein
MAEYQYSYCIHCGRDADGRDGIQCKNCDRVDEMELSRRNDPSLVEIVMGEGAMEFVKVGDLDKIPNLEKKYGIYRLKGELPEEVESQFRKFL